jgi:glutamate synthase domain-containing protein 2
MIWSAVISVGLDTPTAAAILNKPSCPVGVATTDPKKEKGLIVDEKQYRVTNYVTSLHEGMYTLL